MTADAITTEELIEVAETVSPGDEVELETASQAYKNPIPVVDCSVTEWLNPNGNWRTARIDLETELGTSHEIVGVEGGRDPRDHTSGSWYYVRRLEPVDGDPEADETDGSKYTIDNPEGYLTTLKVNEGSGISTADTDVCEALGVFSDEGVTYWRKDGAVHVAGPDGADPPPDAEDVRESPTRERHRRAVIKINWGSLKGIGATAGGHVKLFDREDRVVIRAADENGDLLGQDYEPDGSPLADDGSPHKYSTNGALDGSDVVKEIRFEDWQADPGNGIKCQGCGARVSRRFTRVMEPEEEGSPRVCPNCTELVRTHDGQVREARSTAGPSNPNWGWD